jgi:two-component system, OmpR family, response regulator
VSNCSGLGAISFPDLKGTAVACDVLVLDDDPLVLMTLTEILRDEGFEVEEARTSAEAVGQFREGGPPRVFVTDINLGESKTGLDVAAELRRDAPDLPVIFITGRPDFLADTQLDTRQRLLRKPFSMPNLVVLVRELQQAG